MSLDRIIPVGSTMVSTQMNQICYLYLVDVTDIEKTHKTESEMKDNIDTNGNKTIWYNECDVVKNQDWKSIFIITQALHKGLL